MSAQHVQLLGCRRSPPQNQIEPTINILDRKDFTDFKIQFFKLFPRITIGIMRVILILNSTNIRPILVNLAEIRSKIQMTTHTIATIQPRSQIGSVHIFATLPTLIAWKGI